MKKGFFCQIRLLIILSSVLLSSGCGSSSSSSSTPPAPDTTAPTVPIHLTAVAASDTRVSLRWRASTDNVGVTTYSINRNGALLATTTTATTVYSDTTCTANTTYTYSVAARDAAGNVSQFSSGAVTTTLGVGLGDTSAPQPPGTVNAIASSSNQISLSWSVPYDNIGVSGYNIYRAASASGMPAKIGTSTTTSYTDTGLSPATTYYYVVTAFDGVPNESLNSNQATATTQ